MDIEYFNHTEQSSIVAQFNKQVFQNRIAALLLKTSKDYQCFHFNIKDTNNGKTMLQVIIYYYNYNMGTITLDSDYNIQQIS